ncbi:hypothetical protein [Nocardia testacea]|uniref:hypothetical protein n=1 Tax=Nocardia testacea TaxID=248551 RepID=UPI0033E0DE80
MTGRDAVISVALAIHASDNADLDQPWTWADLDAKQERNYLKLARRLIDAGLITWPPAAPDAPLDLTAAEHLAAIVHNDIDHQWPNWADLHEHARGYVRANVRALDAAGMLDHTTARELISAPGFPDRPDIWAEPRPITWAPSVPDDPPF